MTRLVNARRAILATLMLCAAAPAAAQVQRNFPANALRGTLVVAAPPEVLLNGVPARLAPGARIRDQNNMIAMSGPLAGQKLLVHYTVDPQGALREVWILTPAEAARRPWPETPREAQAWRFDAGAQVWFRP